MGTLDLQRLGLVQQLGVLRGHGGMDCLGVMESSAFEILNACEGTDIRALFYELPAVKPRV